jgi:hypothetical protein
MVPPWFALRGYRLPTGVPCVSDGRSEYDRDELREHPSLEPSLFLQEQTAAAEHGTVLRREDQTPELVIRQQREKHDDRHRIGISACRVR